MKLEPASPASVGMSARQLRRIETLAQNWIDEGIAGGIVMLVARRGKIVLQGAFGRRAPDDDTPPSLDTLYPWGSASTLITITAAMALVDDGLLGLNRPVSFYLPEFQGAGKDKVMVHHLLTHTSGFRNEEVGFPGQVTAATRRAAGKPINIPPHDSNQHPAIHEYLHLTYDAPLNRPPGTEMSIGYYTMELVGEIVRRVTGKPLPEFARARIFEPLGMRNTTFTVPESEWHRVVQLPPDAPFAELMQWALHNTVPWACFGVFTSPQDMAVFGQMFLNHGRYGGVRVLSRAAVSEMTRNQVAGLSAQYRDEHIPEATWGIGWNVHGDKRAFGEGSLQSPQAFYQGNSGGPIVWVDPTYELVGVYFSTALKLIEEEWPGDLFINAVTAAVED